ncbi:MAG: amidohydrolase family protein [Planctomycetota bacterium]
MPRLTVMVVGCLGCILFASSSKADGEPAKVAFKGAKILTAAGKVFDPGTLIVEKGKILEVGPADAVAVVDGVEVRDLAGKVIIPGLVDTHSHLGVYSRPAVSENSDGNEMTGPVQSVVRALDAINPFDPGIKMALAGGVTSANIMPGSGNVIGGQTLYVKYRGDTVEDMRVSSPNNVGGLKMANGENPKRAYGSKGAAPGTRMKVASLQRGEFLKAQDYQREWDSFRKKRATDESASPPKVDVALEPLVEVLQRKRTVHFHTHRADDIMSTLRLADEFGFELLIQHGTESYKVADEIAKRKIPVSMTILDSPGGKAEVVDFLEECGAELHKAGVKVLVNTDDSVTESRFFLRTAATAVRGGLPEEQALRAITIHGAEALHLEDRIGSLEKGKDADFVVLSGGPFSVYSRVLETYVEGKKVFDLNNESDRKYQTGGFAVAEAHRVPKEGTLLEPAKSVNAPAPPAGSSPPNASSKKIAIFAGLLHTVGKGSFENGVVLLDDGKIVFAGARDGFELPADAAVLTAAVVTPGLIDPFATVPLSGEYNVAADQDADERSDPNQAELRVLDAFHPGEPLLRYLLEQGITVVHATPGRANVLAGLSGVFHTHGRTADAMVIQFPKTMMLNLGVSPKEAYPGKRPGTRMGTAALVRAALTEATEYHRKVKAAKDESSRPDHNPKLEALSLVLEKKIPLLCCAQRADDLMTALRILDEFKIDGILGLAAEGYLVDEQIAKSKWPVIVHPTMQRVGDLETFNSFLGNAATLAKKGIRIGICSAFEGYVPKTRVVRFEAAIAMVHGLGFEKALESITLDAAKILGIDDQYGSLEPGKVADVVLYDGDPFEYTTHVTYVIQGGRVVHDRAERKAIPFARRAYFASPEVPCCLGQD